MICPLVTLVQYQLMIFLWDILGLRLSPLKQGRSRRLPARLRLLALPVRRPRWERFLRLSIRAANLAECTAPQVPENRVTAQTKNKRCVRASK
jgi:hypothetical protein